MRLKLTFFFYRHLNFVLVCSSVLKFYCQTFIGYEVRYSGLRIAADENKRDQGLDISLLSERVTRIKSEECFIQYSLRNWLNVSGNVLNNVLNNVKVVFMGWASPDNRASSVHSCLVSS